LHEFESQVRGVMADGLVVLVHRRERHTQKIGIGEIAPALILKQMKRKEGNTWMLRYSTTAAYGARVEANPLCVGLVRDFPRESNAWREVDRLGLLVKINCDSEQAGPICFDALAES